MKLLLLKPYEWPCTVEDCRPGFFVDGDQLCFKTKYGPSDAYNSAGERAHLGDQLVTPVRPEWDESL